MMGPHGGGWTLVALKANTGTTQDVLDNAVSNFGSNMLADPDRNADVTYPNANGSNVAEPHAAPISTTALSTQSLSVTCSVCGTDDWAALGFSRVLVQLDCPNSGECGAHFYFEVTEDTDAAREIWYDYLTTKGTGGLNTGIHASRPDCKALKTNSAPETHDLSSCGSSCSGSNCGSGCTVIAGCGATGDVVAPVYDPFPSSPGWCWWSNGGDHYGAGTCPLSGSGAHGVTNGRRGKMWVM